MSKRTRNVELRRHADKDLRIQYEELLCLRVKLTELLFSLKRSSPRRRNIMRGNRSTAKRRIVPRTKVIPGC